MENKCETVFKCERLLLWKAGFFLLLTLILPLFPRNQVNAQLEADVAVTATVLPARYIIVDKENIIKEVISNTKDNVMPQVCLHNCQENTIELTPYITEQYHAIMSKEVKSYIGIIYHRAKNNTDQKPPNNTTHSFAANSLIAAAVIILL